MKNLWRNTKVRWLLIAVALLAIVAPVGYWAAMKYLKPVVKDWRLGKFNTEAREFLAKDDPLNAVLMARKSLEASRNNPEGWRIAAAASKRLDRRDALFYQDNLVRIERTKENYLELIRLAVKFGQDAFAIDAVTRAAELAVNDPEYYELAAGAYQRLGKPLGARYFLNSLVEMRPTDKKAQLDLAEIEMSEDRERKDTALRVRVRALAEDPAVRARALTLLLRESVAANLKVETAELAPRLQAESGLGVDQQMLLVLAWRMVQPDRVPAARTALLLRASEKPEEVARVMDFLVSLGWTDEVLAWRQRLPEPIATDEQVQRAYAETLLARRDWAGMRTLLLQGPWKNLEFFRRALLAFSYRAENRVAEFDEAWRGAVIEAGGNLRSCVILLSRMATWGWEAEQYDVLWKVFALIPQDRQVRERLLLIERRSGNTANLNRLFARIAEVDPNDRVNLNNFAYTSLLLNANLARAGLITEQLLQAEPENPYFVTARALALHKQGKAEEALRMLEGLRPSALIEPSRVLLHALFLSRTGAYDRAAERLGALVRADLLPEELALARSVEEDLARRSRTETTATRLRRLQEEQGVSGPAKGWMTLVGGRIREKATMTMQLSDTLYSVGDFKALVDALREGGWGEADHVRQALLAYALRERADLTGSLDAWRQAVLLAGRGASALEDLLSLCGAWNWSNERLDVLGRLHANQPTDRGRMEELVGHFRGQRRTADLIRVLKPWVEASTGVVPETAPYVYYCLLSEVDVPAVTVRVQTAVRTSPADADLRLAQAFSLWRQRRLAEAEAQLVGVETSPSGLLSVDLIRGALAVERGDHAAARTLLSRAAAAAALPEEAELARRLSQRLPPG